MKSGRQKFLSPPNFPTRPTPWTPLHHPPPRPAPAPPRPAEAAVQAAEPRRRAGGRRRRRRRLVLRRGVRRGLHGRPVRRGPPGPASRARDVHSDRRPNLTGPGRAGPVRLRGPRRTGLVGPGRQGARGWQSRSHARRNSDRDRQNRPTGHWPVPAGPVSYGRPK